MDDLARYAITYTLAHEGSRFVDDPDDPGGATKYGISLRWAEQEEGLDVDGDGDTDRDDIMQMSRADAMKLYYDRWWQRYEFGSWPSRQLAVKAFDLAVNTGYRRAARRVQDALNDLGADLLVDGRIGPKSKAAMARIPDASAVGALAVHAALYYRGITEARPVFQKYIRGWLRRAASLPVVI